MTFPRHAAMSATARCRMIVALVAFATLLSSCAYAADDVEPVAQPADDGVADYPDWIEKLYPPPGSETSATQAVQVNHNVIAADREVRLLIDGTDVTTYAVATTPGLLEYDMDQAASPVSLEPGEHTAVVELKRVTPGAGEGVDSYDPDVHATVDRYTWTFTVL